MPQRLITARFSNLDLATTGDSIAALARAVSDAAGDRYEVVGWLRRDDGGGMLFLARELESEAFVGLRLTPEGLSDTGEDQFSLSVVRQFDASCLPLGGVCDNCGATLTGWEAFCGQCGYAAPVSETEAARTPAELRAEIEAAAGERFTILGEVPQARGAFFAREKDTGKLAALRLSTGARATAAGATRALGAVTMFEHATVSQGGGGGTVSPHSGPVGPLDVSSSRVDPSAPDHRKKVCPKCGSEYPPDARFCPKDREELRFIGQSEALIGEVVAKKYRIVRKLGGGGMGRVYLAEHIEMGRMDAVKLMLPHWVSDPDALKRFRREALNASKVKHAHVATVYDFGDAEDGAYFLAMEYVQGPTLSKLIEEKGRLEVADAVRIAGQIARALEAAHSLPQPVVHRDLKPDNVLIATREGDDPATDGEVKVVDFGIARAMGDEAQRVSSTKMMIGTPAYMSTEQFAGTRVDGRADVYALGCILYEMLTGEVAYGERDLHAVINHKVMGEVPRVREKRPEIPPRLDDVVAKAMARSSDDRYPSARDFRIALESPVTVSTTTIPEPVPAGASNWRPAVIIGGMAVVAALVWVIVRGVDSQPRTDTTSFEGGGGGQRPPDRVAIPVDSLRDLATRMRAAESAAEKGEYERGARLLSQLTADVQRLKGRYRASSDTLTRLDAEVQLRVQSVHLACTAEAKQAAQKGEKGPICP